MLTWLTHSTVAQDAQDITSLNGKRSLWFRAGTTIPRQPQDLAKAAAELDRARRYQRALTVMVVAGPRSQPTAGDTAHPPAEQWRPFSSTASILESPGTLVAALRSVLEKAVRQSDIAVCDVTHGQCLVLMPETGPAEAVKAARRLRTACLDRVMIPLQVGLATFPHDGWTLEELARRAAELSLEPETEAVHEEAAS